ncbi:uncharacterized protein FIBRA_00992 [Fibroporia radiculosa]|uniref:AMP-dependent synthetase/ligase domain-containing protein n=1 Tax=Fibroporia radiculosa TaxID=599839 RepID=J4H0V0_9APHY|nr:uncharacterized protein FIBRA_00992 [Fibroporia radiculosa]CCL98984.1 predicted protein [Fibroporia radiculosa]
MPVLGRLLGNHSDRYSHSMALTTHLTVLERSASQFSTAPAFKVPDSAGATVGIRRWKTITYEQFHRDVEHSARYWLSKLESNNIRPGSVVGLWLGGLTYLDTLHIFGIARAGYIPQLFSLRLPNPEVIYELMGKVGAAALIYDISFESSMSDCPALALTAVDIFAEIVPNTLLPAPFQPASGEEIAMIFHTSGSTSGSPKLVRCNYKWLDAVIAKTGHISKPQQANRLDVISWMGSMCHIGQTLTLIGALQHGTCVIAPTTIGFSSDEMVDMIDKCGLNCLTQFAPFLAIHLRNARENPVILQKLKSLEEVMYAGVALSAEDEAWARQNGILLRNLFGNTECGAMLRSIGGRGRDAAFLQPIEGTRYAFVPITSSSDSESTYQDINSSLLELVILSESGDCPDPSLRQADGHFHTGDLFVEVAPGSYVSRGRDDDWIKSENCLRCDTKAIEDNVRATCNQLIAECVVVGNGRPSPTLFVESNGDVDAEKLKKDIIRRTRRFHSRRYLHERITSPKFIVVVPPKSLPRTATKGNIRRRAVEEAFKTELDAVYGDASPR